MESFCISLEARDPARGCWRAYRIEAGTDLLGDWLVDVCYGRIGSNGKRIRHVASDEQEARRIVKHCLQRRSSAPKRIGVGYQLCQIDDQGNWVAAIPGMMPSHVSNPDDSSDEADLPDLKQLNSSDEAGTFVR